MSNVIQFPGRKPKAAESMQTVEEKIAALQLATGDADLGLYAWMIQEYSKHLEQVFPHLGTADDFLRQNIAYDVRSPSPGVVNFELFGWVDDSKPKSTYGGDYMSLFCKISQTKITDSVKGSVERGRLCLAKLADLTQSYGKSLEPNFPLVQFMFPMMAIGYLASTGAVVSFYKVPWTIHEKIVVVMQDTKRNTEYRLEANFNALEASK